MIGTYGLVFALISLNAFQALPKAAGTAGKVLTFLITESIVFAFLAGVLALTVALSMISRRNKTILTEYSITLGEDGFTSETPRTWSRKSRSFQPPMSLI
ncbi:MAG: hypothetical protein L0Z50_12730 [Verrucomicrobiales bacterium]|nr:hypothetical protein [Verrucomicrobiales bacterium]